MAIVSKTIRNGIDAVINSLQEMSYPKLLAYWTGPAFTTYTSYPRANKNPKESDTIPEISLDQKDYKEVLMDDKVSITSFWLVDDVRNFQDDTKRIKHRISVIFQCDLVQLYGEAERMDERFNMHVLKVFQSDNIYINSDIEITTGVSGVYDDLSLTSETAKKIQLHDMSNLHVVKLSFDVIHKPDCFATLPPSCAGVSILLNGVFDHVEPSGSTFDCVVGSGIVATTFNGAAAANTTDPLAIQVVDSSDLPIGSLTINLPNTKKITVATPIIYIRPTDSGITTSYKTGDEGWIKLNDPDPYVPPTIGKPAIVDPSNPTKLLFNNAFGHKFRYTGITGGYYDWTTGLYYTVAGVVSTQSAQFGSGTTAYLIDHHTGLGWKWTQNSGALTFSGHITAIHASSHAGFTDWEMASRNQYDSLILFDATTIPFSNVKILPFSTTFTFKSCTNGVAAPATTSFQLNPNTWTVNRTDATNDSSLQVRRHYI